MGRTYGKEKKEEITCRQISENFFWKDGPPSSMVLLVFLESENLLKSPTISFLGDLLN